MDEIRKNISEIKKKCTNRHYREMTRIDCESFKEGNTKGIWETVKRIRNNENKIMGRNNRSSFQTLTMNDGTDTATTEDNIRAWNEYIDENFVKKITKPLGIHLNEHDIDGEIAEYFFSNMNNFTKIGTESERKNYIFTELIKLAAPCSDSDIEKWYNVMRKRGVSRLTRFFEQNPESNMIAENLSANFSQN